MPCLYEKAVHDSISDVTIISDDCWGGEFYREFDLQYRTPFVGLYVEPTDYIYLIQNLDSCLDNELVFITEENKEFPVAMLGSVKLNFMHYKSYGEVIEKWNRRKARINFSKVFFKIDFSPRSPFGAVDYTETDISVWNSICSPRYFAITNGVVKSYVANALHVKNWKDDAIITYYQSRQQVDLLAA